MIQPEYIKSYRKALGMTQGQFAELAGVSTEKVRLHWEKNGLNEKACKEAEMIIKLIRRKDAI